MIIRIGVPLWMKRVLPTEWVLALLLLHTMILGALWFHLTPRKVYVEKNPAIFESDPGAWRLTLYGKDRAAVTPQPGKCLFAEDVQSGNFIWRPCKP